MSFNWSEYLILAQELNSRSATSPIQEAHLRSAISRAYYAAYCKVRNHLVYKDHKPIPRGVKNVHLYVAEEFKISKDTTRQTVGNLLHHLRSIRNKADYQDILGRLPGRTQAALVEAEEIIRLLSTL